MNTTTTGHGGNYRRMTAEELHEATAALSAPTLPLTALGALPNRPYTSNALAHRYAALDEAKARRTRSKAQRKALKAHRKQGRR